MHRRKKTKSILFFWLLMILQRSVHIDLRTRDMRVKINSTDNVNDYTIICTFELSLWVNKPPLPHQMSAFPPNTQKYITHLHSAYCLSPCALNNKITHVQIVYVNTSANCAHIIIHFHIISVHLYDCAVFPVCVRLH